MATLQNLRNRGPLLVGFVGLALFAFILSDLFKSNGSNAEEKAVGTINDERFSAYEYEEIRGLFECVAAYNSHAKSSISELATIDAWETLRDMKTAQMQAEELGIKVTPQEIDLWLTKLTPYQLDLILKNNNREKEMYLSKYNPEELNSISRIPAEFCDIDPSNGNPTAINLDSISKYRAIAETGTAANEKEALLCNISRLIDLKLSTIAINSILMNILDNGSIVNHAVAMRNHNNNNSTSEIEYAVYPYSNIANEDITVSDAEIAKYYEDNKEYLFKNNYDSRDVQVISIELEPSQEDRMLVREEMNEYVKMIEEDSLINYYELSLISQSEFKYDEYLWTLDAIEYDVVKNQQSNHFAENIKNAIMAAGEGELVGPYVDPADMTDNIFINLEKKNIADEYMVRFAVVASQSADSVNIVTDSLLTALNNGAEFSGITNNFFGLDSLKFKANEFAVLNTQLAMAARFVISPEMQKAIYSNPVGEYNTIEYNPNAKVIYQVMERSETETVAYKTFGIKRTIMVSPETRDLAYNELSKFITECDSIEKFASHPYAYPVYDVNNNNITLSNISGTRDILAWIMDESATKGRISNIYDKDNNSLVAVGISNVYPKGYHPIDREIQPGITISDYIKEELIREKKAEKIMAEINGKSLEAIKGIAGVVADSAAFVEYKTPVAVTSQGVSEPVISAVAANLDIAKDSNPIKGNAGVYVVKVISKQDKGNALDVKAETEYVNMMYGNSGYFMDAALSELYNVDNKVNAIYNVTE